MCPFAPPDTLVIAAVIVAPNGLVQILSGLSAGQIVVASKSDDGTLEFALPEDRARLLTRQGGDENMAPYVEEVPLLVSAAFDQLQTRVRDGAGIGYEPYAASGFCALMEGMTHAKHRKMLVPNFLLQGFPAMAHLLKQGARVLDIGCGSGTAVCILAKTFPRSHFTGLDLSEVALTAATAAAAKQQLRNVAFVQADAATMDQILSAGSFDWVTAFDAIHDQTKPSQVLSLVARLLKPTGVFSMIDIRASSDLSDNLTHVFAPFLYGVSLLHCLPVGKQDGGAGLGMMWGAQLATAMLQRAGFTSIIQHEIPGDVFNVEFRCTLHPQKN